LGPRYIVSSQGIKFIRKDSTWNEEVEYKLKKLQPQYSFTGIWWIEIDPMPSIWNAFCLFCEKGSIQDRTCLDLFLQNESPYLRPEFIAQIQQQKISLSLLYTCFLVNRVRRILNQSELINTVS